MGDTGVGARRTVAAAILGLAAFTAAAAAEPAPLSSKVLWVHAGRVYIASSDSLPLAHGDLLTFTQDRKTVASAVVEAIHDATLAIGRVESGSLDRVKKLDRLRVLVERRPMRSLSTLRIGLPARSNLLFACDSPKLHVSAAGYRADTLSQRSYRLVRDYMSSGIPPWPDTLLVRMFEDSSDEEIALERGELDIAVFWPGELSTRMRENSNWREPLSGTSSRGALVAALPQGPEPGGYSARDSATFVSMNEEVFRGDLALVPDSRGGRRAEFSRRFQVDRVCPGWERIENFLNRATEARPERDVESIRVSFGESLHRKLPYGGPSRVLFAVRCPVVCAPALRPHVKALGPDELVNMLDCRPARGTP